MINPDQSSSLIRPTDDEESQLPAQKPAFQVPQVPGTAQPAGQAPLASPAGSAPTLPLAQAPSGTATAGQGGEQAVPVNPTTPPALSTPDPLAFAPSASAPFTPQAVDPGYHPGNTAIPAPTQIGEAPPVTPTTLPLASPAGTAPIAPTAPQATPTASSLPAGQAMDTPDSVAAYIASLGDNWTPQEKASIQAQETNNIGQAYTTDQYGTRSYVNGGGTLDTRNPGANNFSTDPAQAETPLDNTTPAQQQAVNDAATQTFLNNMTPEARAAYLADPNGGFSYGQGSGDSTAYSTGPGITDPNNNPTIQWQGDSGNGPARYLESGVEVDANGQPITGGYNATDDAAQQAAAQGYPPASSSPSGSPSDGTATAGQGQTTPTTPTNPTGQPVSTAPGPTTSTNPATPTNPAGPTLPIAPPPPSVPPPTQAVVPPAMTSPGSPSTSTGTTSATAPGTNLGYATLSPTTPQNALTNSTILPGSQTDRIALANRAIQDWDTQDQPLFTRDVRTANLNAASRGQLGSGALNSSLGDVVNNHASNRTTAESQYLTTAQTGAIDDAYKNIGILQQQQGFESGQQQINFGQNVQLQQLADSEQGQQWTQYLQALGFNAQQIQQAFTNAFQVQQLGDSENSQSFYQALEQMIQGAQGDPTQLLEEIAKQYATPVNYNAPVA